MKTKTIDRTIAELKAKYFRKSNNTLVVYDIYDDIRTFKKFEDFNAFEIYEIFKRAVEATDGEDSYRMFLENHNLSDEVETVGNYLIRIK